MNNRKESSASWNETAKYSIWEGFLKKKTEKKLEGEKSLNIKFQFIVEALSDILKSPTEARKEVV